MPPARRSLVTRVAIGNAVAAGITALLAAVASLVLVERLGLAAEDRRLRGTAAIATREIRDPSRLEAIEHEVREVAPENIRLTVFSSRRFVGGDPSVSPLDPDTCVTSPNGNYRVCAMGSEHLCIAAASPRSPRNRTAEVVACALAALLAAGIAASLSRRAATWALEPLTRLRRSLDALTEANAGAVSGEDYTLETAALRGAIADLVARLAVSLDAARRFSADAAHEIKTPLTVLRAELELLAEEPLPADVQATLEKLGRRIEALARLVDRLLALSNASDRTRLAREAVALEDVFDEVIARLGEPARSRVVVHHEAQGMVVGDETLLAAVIENAVDNALKFSSGAVSASVAEANGSVIVTVCDRGPGIPESERERVFEPFFRTPASRASALPGHGVGLALVQQVVHGHGGTARFVDPPGEQPGVALRIVLPAWRPPG